MQKQPNYSKYSDEHLHCFSNHLLHFLANAKAFVYQEKGAHKSKCQRMIGILVLFLLL